HRVECLHLDEIGSELRSATGGRTSRMAERRLVIPMHSIRRVLHRRESELPPVAWTRLVDRVHDVAPGVSPLVGIARRRTVEHRVDEAGDAVQWLAVCKFPKPWGRF